MKTKIYRNSIYIGPFSYSADISYGQTGEVEINKTGSIIFKPHGRTTKFFYLKKEDFVIQ